MPITPPPADPAPGDPRRPARPPEGSRVRWDDWVMLLLAVAAVGSLGYLTFGRPGPDLARTLVRVDYGFCAVFAAEFVIRWARTSFSRRFLAVNWFDVVGMVPVAHLAFRSFRLLRAVRVVVLLTKARMKLDRSVGEELAHRAMGRFGGLLIGVVKRPLTVAVLEEVVSVMRTGHYARNLSAALTENRAEIREMVLEKIRQDQTAGRLRYLPFHDEILGTVTDTTLRVVLEILADPRTDELVADLLRENIEQIRQAVRAGDHRGLPDHTPAGQ